MRNVILEVRLFNGDYAYLCGSLDIHIYCSIYRFWIEKTSINIIALMYSSLRQMFLVNKV